MERDAMDRADWKKEKIEELNAMPIEAGVSISREEAFDLGRNIEGALRFCHDGRDIGRQLGADGMEAISDLDSGIGFVGFDIAKFVVFNRIRKRLSLQDQRAPTWKPKPDAPGWWVRINRANPAVTDCRQYRQDEIDQIERDSGEWYRIHEWYGPIPAIPERGKE